MRSDQTLYTRACALAEHLLCGSQLRQLNKSALVCTAWARAARDVAGADLLRQTPCWDCGETTRAHLNIRCPACDEQYLLRLASETMAAKVYMMPPAPTVRIDIIPLEWRVKTRQL